MFHRSPGVFASLKLGPEDPYAGLRDRKVSVQGVSPDELVAHRRFVLCAQQDIRT